MAVIEVAGGLRIAVPDAIELMTPYVLREQERWFEDEWDFVRRLVRPGERAVDIGANYGVYTLPLAKALGDRGHLWAFEPASSTVDYLARSVALNFLDNVTLVRAALSDRVGSASLFLSENAELNSLNVLGSEGVEEVPLRTLDRCREEFGWDGIAFVKLDAEGEELNILRGGGMFFAEESPVVMYELKHGEAVNLPLIEAFAELGYRSYRLVPGLCLLAPIEKEEVLDPFQLNLFCCKEDRVAGLEGAGLLASNIRGAEEEAGLGVRIDDTEFPSLPFVRGVQGAPSASARGSAPSGAIEQLRVIELYLGAHAPTESPRRRYAALLQAFATLEPVCGVEGQAARLSTFARVAWELGRRRDAVEAIVRALRTVQRTRTVNLDEPFLAAAPRFDHVDPAGRPVQWFVASLLEQLERLRAFSSFLVGPPSIANLERLAALGFQSPEMERRRQLVRMRMGRQRRPTPSPLLSATGEDNRNPSYWR